MTYRLFRYRTKPHLWCAVPQDRLAPAFATVADLWEPMGTTTPDAPRPEGFHEGAAQYACRVQGFYVFRALSRPSRGRAGIEIKSSAVEETTPTRPAPVVRTGTQSS